MKKLLICAILLCGMAVFAAEFVFAENNKANYTIVIPDKTAGFEEQAAKDLQEFFKKMSGANFVIIKEAAAPAKNAIYIGNTAFAKKHGVNIDKLTPETWVIKSAGNNLVLSGGHPIGSFYAVWQILNKLGCYPLTWDQYSTPELAKMALNVKDEVKKPVFNGRLIWDSAPGYFFHTKIDKSIPKAYQIWKLRAGINGSQGRHDIALWKYSAHNICQFPAWHTLSQFVHPRLFDKHPEYFSMNALGRRFKPKVLKEGSLCMSNPDVKRLTLESLRAKIKKDRSTNPKEKWATVYDISTLDNSPFICYCPECKKITAYEGSETGLLLQYINHVATEIKKEYPDIIIRTYGYSASATPPKKIMPADNVLIQLTDKFTVSDPYKPLTHPINHDRHPYFKAWQKAAKRLMVWDYWNLGGSYYKPPRPDTVVNSIQPDLKYYHKTSVTDMFIEAGRSLFAPQSFIDLSYFLGTQLMMDPYQDQERLIDIYFESYFGPAAKEMRKIFNVMRKGAMTQKNRQTTAVVSHWLYLTPEYVYNSYATMKKLAASVPQPYKQRVMSEMVNFTWYAVAKRPSYRKIFKANGINIDDLVEEVRRLAKAHIRRNPCRTPEKLDKDFEKKYAADTLILKRPEQFKNIPDENIRMIAYPNFRGVGNFNARVVKDPDSIQGNALCAANLNPEFHGVNKFLPKTRHGFKTTHFKWSNHKASGGVETVLKAVPQDEKYHWYRLPGKFEMKPLSYFWGFGWAIQASTQHLYTLTDGNPLDNTWDQIWVSAKFTGPAYVKGSTKPNAIWVDMAVLIRNEKDPQFTVPAEYNLTTASKLPNGWINDRNAVNLEIKDGKPAIVVSEKSKHTRVVGPFSPITVNDTITMELRSNLAKANVGFFFYDKDKKLIGRKLYRTNGSELDRIVLELSDLKFKKTKTSDIASFRVYFAVPKGKAVTYDQFELKIGKDINSVK